MDRKLIRSGTGWCIYINNTIIDLLNLNPETDLIKYTVENDKLIISKSANKRDNK